MDKVFHACVETIKKYDSIKITHSTSMNGDAVIDFVLLGMSFSLLMNCSESSNSMPFVTINDSDSAVPHFLTYERTVAGQSYRPICLYEHEHYVAFLFTVEEKIDFCVNQLIRLLELTKKEQELEYQKEFLYYWASHISCNCEYELYLKDDCPYGLLELFEVKDGHFALVHPEIRINKQHKEKWRAVSNRSAIFLNIKDINGILPPHKNFTWDIKNVLDIIDNKQRQRIPYEAYRYIVDLSYSQKSIVFVFQLNDLVFGCEVQFKHRGTGKLMHKIKNQFELLKLLNIERRDFLHINKQVGNSTELVEKEVAIIGVGSLGSYLASEIVKAGIKKLHLVDSDKLESNNLQRHRSNFAFVGVEKTIAMLVDLHQHHPEIVISFENKKLEADNLPDFLSKKYDLLIFAGIGSDAQLRGNRALAESEYKSPVIFCWLEGDGISGHAVGIKYEYDGCLQCLFTDKDGKSTPNRVNKSTEDEVKIIRDGCGGVRVAYGNSILLQTTALVLSAVKHVFSDGFSGNFVYSVSDNTFSKLNSPFYERTCVCCNDSN